MPEPPAVPEPRGAVLVADDSETVRVLLRIELEEAGYVVHEAENGRDALEVARSTALDVVLLDVEMPLLDGYQTIAALKGDATTADVPVVFLTGRVGTSDVVRGLQLGGHDYLRKPPEPGELLARVAAAARVKALQDELRSRADELDRVSRTDVLTGLYNRRHVEEQLRSHGSGARRHGLPLSVLLVDVDHFKAVNDTVGHGGGDLVLQAVASTLLQTVRTEDIIGRWGGEEFLLLLPHTDASAAAVLAERLRTQVGALCVPVGDRQVSVTLSIGGAAAEQPGDHDLVSLADAQLYLAKHDGRDRVRVVVAGPGVAPVRVAPGVQG